MHPFKALLSLTPLVSGALSAAVTRSSSSCHDLWEKAPSLLPDLEVYYAGDYPAGTNFSDPVYQSVAYPDAVPDLPAFCRFGAWIHTSNHTKAQFEVWLPKPSEWSGRFLMVGNGGDAGGVNFPDMGVPLSKYHMAVASTDTGHWGVSGNGTFAAGDPESQIDFGYRAVHLTTVYSKKVIEAYYGKKQDKAYWLGCSSGGKQGLKEVQLYPDEYDGVIAGAAAQYWSRLLGQIYHLNVYVNGNNTEGYLTRADYNTIHAQVLAQCDELDNVKDNVLTDPTACIPDLKPLSCDLPNANSTSCLTDAKIATMQKIWANWAFTNGSLIYPGQAVGSEGLSAFSVTGSPYQLSPDYYSYSVQNNTDTTKPFEVADEEVFKDLVTEAIQINPGGINAVDPNIGNFLKRGKLITYHGYSDTIIPSHSSILYRNEVQKALGWKNLDDSYRLFMVPGMGHCRTGPGAWAFGEAQQRPAVLAGQGQSSQFDAEHDALLAIIEWVEKGIAPKHIVSTKWTNDNMTQGVSFTRKLCPYPQQGTYIAGDVDSADSFECR
ncbi:hypothetical protein JCM10207_007619 [Rhodosporidiobolus poonsookiae]